MCVTTNNASKQQPTTGRGWFVAILASYCPSPMDETICSTSDLNQPGDHPMLPDSSRIQVITSSAVSLWGAIDYFRFLVAPQSKRPQSHQVIHPDLSCAEQGMSLSRHIVLEAFGSVIMEMSLRSSAAASKNAGFSISRRSETLEHLRHAICQRELPARNKINSTISLLALRISKYLSSR